MKPQSPWRTPVRGPPGIAYLQTAEHGVGETAKRDAAT
jgi:hypothetical protein